MFIEGVDVGVLWSYMMEETEEPGENHQPWMGDHYPATCGHWDLIPDRSSGKQVH